MTPPGHQAFLHRARRVFLLGCVILWICAFVVTHTPREDLPGPRLPGGQAHGGGYFALGCMLYVTLAAYRVPRRRRAVAVVAVLAAYGALDEITQPLAGRTADMLDWVADVIGALAAAAVCTGVSIARTAARRKK